jgi:predicted MFS family arabinose efflux permease
MEQNPGRDESPILRPRPRSRLDLAAKRLRSTARSITLPPPVEKVEDRNLYYLQREVLWTGLVSSAMSFGGNFAVRLGASNMLMGALSSGPSLIAMLLTLPAARFLEGRSDRIKWIVMGRGIQRAIFVLIALMPFVIPPEHRAIAYVALTLLRQVPLAPQSAGWSALFADLVPEQRRTEIVARRRMLMSGITIIASPLLGRLLDQLVFPYGYQIAFSVAFAAGMMGTFDLIKLQDPTVEREADRQSSEDEETPPPKRTSLRDLPQLLTQEPAFMRILVSTLALSLGAWVAMPLYTIHYVRNLGFTDAWIGTLTSAANVSLILGTWLWRKLIPRVGEYKLLRLLMPFLAVFSLAVGMAKGQYAVLAAVMFHNLIVAGTNLTHFNTLLKVAPAEQRTTAISLYSTVMQMGAFLAPMLGTSLADRIPIPTILIAMAGFRLLGGLLFTIWPSEPRAKQEPATA